MNHALDRLLDGIVQTLRLDIIPKLEGEFVRGQAFGIIYALKSLKLRTSWSPMFLIEQLDALQECGARLSAIAHLPPEAPRPELPATYPHDAARLEALRDAGDAKISALIVWLGAHRAVLPEDAALAADAAIKAYISRQLKHELKTSAKPMFAEISLGKEQES
jgi:hypothetical protein